MVPGGPWPPGNPSQNRGPHKPLKNSGLFGIGQFGRRKKIRRNPIFGRSRGSSGIAFLLPPMRPMFWNAGRGGMQLGSFTAYSSESIRV